ncbi:MAG TPA: phosphatase PAP2 family protein [Burkholderiales bacterium]|nr:phosphatase PAP2 family protein [Burkholderiales bacterium]
MTFAIIPEISGLDDQILIWINQYMARWPLLDKTIAWLLNANIIKFVPMLAAGCWLWFEKSLKQAINRRILLESLLASIAALVIGRTLALMLPFRDRPFVRPELHFVTTLQPILRTWSSFPSDHAVLAFALAASLFRVSPKVGIWALFHATVIICLPRLYFGLHHPSDLMAGALIGILAIIMFSRIRVLNPVTNYLLGIENKHPGAFYAMSFFVLYNIGEMFLSFRIVANYVFHVLKLMVGD